MFTEREKYIKNTFFYNLEEKEAVDIVSKISEIGRNSIGWLGVNISSDDSKNEKRKHKYDSWIAKEVKKDIDILDMKSEIRLIIDWVSENKIDIFNYNFDQAFHKQEVWHSEMAYRLNIESIDIPEIDEERILFRCSNKKYFFYKLTPDDLTFEGQSMGHCVGSKSYKSKVKNKSSIIISLRDIKNNPHVTIEIDTLSKSIIQQFGKSNDPPIIKYVHMIWEFALFISEFKQLENKEVLKFLNVNLKSK